MNKFLGHKPPWGETPAGSTKSGAFDIKRNAEMDGDPEEELR